MTARNFDPFSSYLNTLTDLTTNPDAASQTPPSHDDSPVEQTLNRVNRALKFIEDVNQRTNPELLAQETHGQVEKAEAQVLEETNYSELDVVAGIQAELPGPTIRITEPDHATRTYKF